MLMELFILMENKQSEFFIYFQTKASF